MGRDMVARFILRLRDLVSPGIQALQRRLVALRNVAQGLGVIGTAIAAISFVAPIRQAAAFEDVLRQSAITAGLSGQAVEAAIARQGLAYERLALQTGQRSQAIAEAAADLQAANLAPDVIDGLLPALARAATATGASLREMTNVGIALNQNLGIGPAEMADTLGALAQAGKEGRFELRDMAREFPALTSAVGALGLSGREAANSLAAMLQVARQGAATGSEAANNLTNLISKITSPETVRNFAELGTDLPGLIRNAQAQGINPVEAVIQRVREIGQGDMFRVGELFGDMQVLNALRPFMTGTAEYLRILDSVRQANRSVLDTDFETRMRGLTVQMTTFEERIGQLGGRAGMAFGSNLGWINDTLAFVQGLMTDLDRVAPGAIDLLLSVAGAGTALAVVLGVLGVAWPAVAAGFAVMRVALLALAGPLGLAIATLAGGAWLIWRNWDRLVAAGRSFVQAIRDQWQPLAEFFNGLWDGIERRFSAVWDRIRPILERVQEFFGRGEENANMAPEAQAERRRRFGARGNLDGFYAPAITVPGPAPLQGEIVVRPVPGAEVDRAQSNRRDVPLVVEPNRGRILGTD